MFCVICERANERTNERICTIGNVFKAAGRLKIASNQHFHYLLLNVWNIYIVVATLLRPVPAAAAVVRACVAVYALLHQFYFISVPRLSLSLALSRARDFFRARIRSK